MKNAIKLVRRVIYFPLGFFPKIGVSQDFAQKYLRQISRLDRHLLVLLVGVRQEV